MKYHNIGDAIAGMIDQTTRGMSNHEYDLHINRLKRYANIIEECEDALTCFSEEEHADPKYKRWADRLAKYQTKLNAEMQMGL